MAVLLSSLVNQVLGYLGASMVPGILGNRHPSIAPYQTFATADRPIALAVGTDKQFRLFAEVLGRPELADDERYATNPARTANRESLTETIEVLLKMRGADDWYRVLTQAGVITGPINELAEAFAFAQQLGLPATVSAPGAATLQVANPVDLSSAPFTYRSAPPTLGRRRRS